MIPLSSMQRTAEDLMAKAAIEIPDDYLAGLRRCADTEKGDLSAFVIKAMLENYEAAKEDRRAMCGDTGLPRWYVKIGNEARIEGGPVALEAALRRATARATDERAAAAQPRASALAHRPQQQCRHRRARDRIRVPSRRRLDRAHHRAQGRPVRLRLPHAVSRRRHRGHQAVLPRYADRLRQARPRLPAGDRRRRARRLEGHLHGAGQAGVLPAHRRLAQSGSRGSPRWKRSSRISATASAWARWASSGSSMVVDCHIEVGYCHTGGMPMSRAHVLPVVAPRLRAHFRRRPSRSSAPIRCGSPTTCGAPRSNGAQPPPQAAE